MENKYLLQHYQINGGVHVSRDVLHEETVIHFQKNCVLSGFPQRLENLEKMVMEKPWNMRNLPKIMEFCDQSWHFTNFAPKCYQICIFVVTTKILSSDLENLHFTMFSAKRHKCKIGLRNCHGIFFFKSAGTMFYVKSISHAE